MEKNLRKTRNRAIEWLNSVQKMDANMIAIYSRQEHRQNSREICRNKIGSAIQPMFGRDAFELGVLSRATNFKDHMHN